MSIQINGSEILNIYISRIRFQNIVRFSILQPWKRKNNFDFLNNINITKISTVKKQYQHMKS